MVELVNGDNSLDSPYLQSTMMDWMEAVAYNLFVSRKSGKHVFAQACKRGNVAYATKKTHQMKRILKSLDGKTFDTPVKGSRKRRMTHLLFVTFSFDRVQFTKEEAWAALRSKPIEGCDCKYNVINGLDANLTKIFGSHGRIVSKEAQESGYPAPHMIVLLDEPVEVELVNGKKGQSWRLCSPRILKRIGKDPQFRRMSFKDHRKALAMNPIWKYGFIDFEGIINGTNFRHKKNALTYPFKYLVKCLTGTEARITESARTIDEIKDKGHKTALYTHLGNKCFGTRDITIGKGFKERIGLMKETKDLSEWDHVRRVSELLYNVLMKNLELSLLKKDPMLPEGLPR